MWIITRDLLEEGKCVGVSSRDYDAERQSLLTEQFRLLDGDGIPYFEGISDDAESIAAFAPLEDFGEGYAGCAAIEYLVRGGWRAT